MFSLINVLFNNLPGHPNCGVGSCFSALNWKTLASVQLPFLLLLLLFPFSPLLLLLVSKYPPPISPATSFVYHLACKELSQLCRRSGKTHSICLPTGALSIKTVQKSRASALSTTLVWCQVYLFKTGYSTSDFKQRYAPKQSSIFCESFLMVAAFFLKHLRSTHVYFWSHPVKEPRLVPAAKSHFYEH